MTRPTFADPGARYAVHAFVDELLFRAPPEWKRGLKARNKARCGIYADYDSDRGPKARRR
jgi:hypothetical protein